MTESPCVENELFSLSTGFHFHKWKEVFNTHMRSYQECSKCKKRRYVTLTLGGYQPLDRDWLDKKAIQRPRPPKGTRVSTAETEVTCPFCKITDFDLIGLKMHFLRGRCEKYNETSLYQGSRIIEW